MTIIKPNFTVLNSGIDPAIAVLRSKLSITDTDIPDEELKKIKSIKVVGGELGDKDYVFDDKNYVLRIARTRLDVIEALRSELDLKQAAGDKLYDSEGAVINGNAEAKDETPLELTSEEEKSHASLRVLSELLDRTYNRRTTLTSWISYFVFQSFGLKNDDFGTMATVLKEADFAQVFTEYRRLAQEDKSSAETYLTTAFKKKTEDDKVTPEAKQKLVKTASFLIDNYNKLNMGFVQTFPKIFCIQNMAMPFLKWLCPKIKLFDFMVTINPWIYDLVSENLGNYAGEIKEIQDCYSEKDKNKEKVLSEVNLTSLSFEEFSLQKIMKNITNGFDRVVGKESTVSSIIATKILKSYDYDGFKAFAKKFTYEDEFIKKLYEGLKKNAANPDGKALEEEFGKGTTEHLVAQTVWGITSGAVSVTPKWVKEYSNTFGAIFVPLNLTMPLLAKVFDKGFLGFVTHSLLKVFPIVNELVFDHFANFRKEILDIQKETDNNKSVAQLFKKVEVKSVYEALTTSFNYLYTSIKGFANRSSSPKPVVP